MINGWEYDVNLKWRILKIDKLNVRIKMFF